MSQRLSRVLQSPRLAKTERWRDTFLGSCLKFRIKQLKVKGLGAGAKLPRSGILEVK